MPNDTILPPTLNLVTLTANIVAAYAYGNHFTASELPKVVTAVHRALVDLVQLQRPATFKEEMKRPTAGEIRESITQDALFSFLDGKPYKTLKRHLSTHGLAPHGYRQRYGLPSDYPMVAPNYAARRSEIAKAIQLGQPIKAG